MKVDMNNITQWTTYRALAGTTESQPEGWSEESKDCLRLVHHMLGIHTELNELFPLETGTIPASNAVEELGDLLWYLAGMQILLIDNGYGHEILNRTDEAIDNLTPLPYDRLHGRTEGLRQASAKLLDKVKRVLAYSDGSFPTDAISIYDNYHQLVNAAIRIIKGHGEEVVAGVLMTANIAKLSKRYSDGFDATEAVNRRLEVEAKAMQEVEQRTNFVKVERVKVTSERRQMLDVEGALERQAGPIANRGGTCKSGGC